MDLSTVLGVALAWLFVGTAIYLGADGKAAALIDPTSFLVVLGGCTAATMAAFPSPIEAAAQSSDEDRLLEVG